MDGNDPGRSFRKGGKKLLKWYTQAVSLLQVLIKQLLCARHNSRR